MQKSKQLKNKKSKAKIFWIVSVLVCVVAIFVGLWYEYVYNPIISYKDFGVVELREKIYTACLMNTTGGSKTEFILREHFCECVAKNLRDEIYDETIRRRDLHSKEDIIWAKCKKDTKFSLIPNDELKSLFEKTCRNTSGAHQSKFCGCFGNNVVYYMRQYSYESAIILNYDNILKKSAEMCAGYLK